MSAAPLFTLKFHTGDCRLYHGDCIKVMHTFAAECVDFIFADPPYFLSGGGSTCHGGKRTSVDKGKWDTSRGMKEVHAFNLDWLRACRRILKPCGTIMVSGTMHNIFSVGYAMQVLGFKLLNDIVWYKVNPPPNLGCRCFVHSTETIIWATRDIPAKNRGSGKYYFNYAGMKELNGGKQMQSLWRILPPRKAEKRHGKHPTQKPLELLERIILGCVPPGGLVLDPFNGSGTTGVAVARLGESRSYIGIDMDVTYLERSVQRLYDFV